jgi:MFS transporter, MHS family, shikimate and dehydroshikimate transport protein
MSIVLAGFTPAIAAALVLWSGGSTWPLVVIVIVTTLIAAAAVSAAKETKDVELSAIGRTAPVNRATVDA